jgi:hypothetical protein
MAQAAALGTSGLKDRDNDEISDYSEESSCRHGNYSPAFNEDDRLSHLFAAVTTELLTYWRIHEGEPWMLGNIDLLDLLQGLEKDDYLLSIGLVQKSLLRPICRL